MESPQEDVIDVGTYGRLLADAIVTALPQWAAKLIVQYAGTDHHVCGQAIGNEIVQALDGPLHDLLRTSIDAQRQTPLALVRAHIEPMTTYLQSIGVSEVQRDPYDEEAFPNDMFGLAPTSWADFGEAVSDAALRWGAAKAMAHAATRRSVLPRPSSQGR